MDMPEISPSLASRFLDAGWFRGRSVPVPDWVPASHPAHAILAVYGGLTIPESEPEEGWPVIEELVFEALPVSKVSRVWSRLVKSELVGIARVHSDHAELFIDEPGRCYGRSLIHDAFWYQGDSFGQAVESILLHVRAQPMLRPGQVAVSMYGEWYTASSPEIYQY